MTLYTDLSPTACAVLRARVQDGSLPAGDVLQADVRHLDAAALAPHRHVHLFAGIAGSPLGLAWAGSHSTIITSVQKDVHRSQVPTWADRLWELAERLGLTVDDRIPGLAKEVVA